MLKNEKKLHGFVESHSLDSPSCMTTASLTTTTCCFNFSDKSGFENSSQCVSIPVDYI